MEARKPDSRLTDLRIGGSLLFVAGLVVLMGIITAEALYPGTYSTRLNEISDLGGTRQSGSIVPQPSAAIFDSSMIAIGLLVLAGAFCVHRVFRRRQVTAAFAVMGVAAIGVGAFPEATGTPHVLSALVLFTSGGVAAILAGRLATGPFRYLSFLVGVLVLVAFAAYLLAGDLWPLSTLGSGGMERWVAYPTILWVIAFGGYLAGRVDGITDAPGYGKIG